MKGIRQGLITGLLSFGLAFGVGSAELAGQEAPDFVLKSTSGTNYRLSEYRGQVVLVSFWASWCGECRSQLEELGELYERFSGTGLEMLSISLDRDLDDVADTASALGVGFPALHDVGGVVGEQYDVSRMPYVLLIDQAGVVRDEFEGFNRGEEEHYLERARALLSQ